MIINSKYKFYKTTNVINKIKLTKYKDRFQFKNKIIIAHHKSIYRIYFKKSKMIFIKVLIFNNELLIINNNLTKLLHIIFFN